MVEIIFNGQRARDQLVEINEKGILPGDWAKNLGVTHHMNKKWVNAHAKGG